VHTTTELAGEAMDSGAPASRVAHAALFQRILRRIYAYFRRMTRDEHEADDCLQQTLLLLQESLTRKTYDPDRSFNTWMWLKARTVWAQWCRKRERRPQALPEAVSDPRDDVAAATRRSDAAVILEQVRERLGDEAYEAFVLYYEGGLTQAEVAATLERDRKTVRDRIRSVHALIDELLGKES